MLIHGRWMNAILFWFLLLKGTTWKAEESFLAALSIHPRRNQRLPSCQTKPGTAGWSIPDKGSEVRAVKRLLTSHFICQTFISLFMVQCTPSVQAMLHTCAWNTFKAFSPTFHDLIGQGKMAYSLQGRQIDRHGCFFCYIYIMNIHVTMFCIIVSSSFER